MPYTALTRSHTINKTTGEKINEKISKKKNIFYGKNSISKLEST